MARFPCDVDGQRFRGKSFYFYPTIAYGQYTDRKRLRVCTAHAENVIRNLAEASAFDETLGVFVATDPELCLICGDAPAMGDRFVYITTYPTQDERTDYWGNACLSCGADGRIFQATLEPVSEPPTAPPTPKRSHRPSV